MIKQISENSYEVKNNKTAFWTKKLQYALAIDLILQCTAVPSGHGWLIKNADETLFWTFDENIARLINDI